MAAMDCVFEPWVDGDWAPCFRQIVVDGLFPMLVLVWFAVGVSRACWRRGSVAYAPLTGGRIASYGAARVSARNNGTDTPGYVVKPTSRSMYSFARALAVIPWCTCCYFVLLVCSGHYDHDTAVEGSNTMMLVFSHAMRALVWGYCSVFALVQLAKVDVPKGTMDAVCLQLNWLYVMQLMVGIVDFRSFYVVHGVTRISDGYWVAAMSSLWAFLILSIVIHEERAAPLFPLMADTGRVYVGTAWASIYAHFTFAWLNGLMRLGYTRPINDDDLFELSDSERARHVLAAFHAQRHSSIVGTLFHMYRRELVIQFIYALIWSLSLVGPAFFLNRIVHFIEDPNSDVSVSTACLFVFGLLFTTITETLGAQQALFIGRTLGIRIEAILIGKIFAKTLRRRDTAQHGTSEKASGGDINNLLSVDAQKLAVTSAYLVNVYSNPMHILFCFIGLYWLLGASALWGVLTICTVQPVLVKITKHFGHVQAELMRKTDVRMRVLNEMLGAIRIIKFFAWESEFRKRIMAARNDEVVTLRTRLMTFIWNSTAWSALPVILMLVVFYTYTRDHELTAATAFTAITLFNSMRQAMGLLPTVMANVMQSKVALARIEAFLNEDELETVEALKVPPLGMYIGFVGNACFGWQAPSSKSSDSAETASSPFLIDLNLSFPRGKMSIVCGPTSSGKSTLLASLLGETYIYRGRAVLPPAACDGIAYVAQTPWLQNGTIRDNILFGADYDEERYAKVLYMTALTRDLEFLEYGDTSLIGEKGISLSGGQKQRLAIARAVYSQAETIILDDVLSALDAHTAAHVYEHCLQGELMCDRTVILVTHYIGMCIDTASYMVVLHEGRVRAAGKTHDVLQSGALGDELAVSNQQEQASHEEAAEEGPIPMVPRRAKAAKLGDGCPLVHEETIAKGGVDWSVYKRYYAASGGVVVSQDYWIKTWASSYRSDDAFQHDTAYYLGVYMAIGLLYIAVSPIRLAILYMSSLRASRRLHEQLLDRILRAKMRFFETQPVGRIINRFSADLQSIDQELANMLSQFIAPVVSTTFELVIITMVTPIFLIPGVFIAVLFLLMGLYYLRTSRELQRLTSVCRSPVYVQFGECINGVATIRAFGCQTRFIQENHEKIDTKNRPFYLLWAATRWLNWRVYIAGASVCFCVGMALVFSKNVIDPGLAGLALTYALRFTDHLLWLVRNSSIVEMNMNAVERLGEYCDIEEEAPAHIPDTKPRASWPEHGAVNVKDLVVRYSPETPDVLHKISFDVKPQEHVAIVGRTGSGKSTLCLSLFRFMEASGGTIHIDGVDISTIGLEDLRSKLISIPQEALLFSGTLRSNLDPFGEHDDATLWAALKRSHLLGTKKGNNSHAKTDDNGMDAADISLDTIVAENGKNWSQGQRQLIALARALVKKSALIILDEATSSVDFDTDRRIQRTIRAEFKDSALICIAHRLRTIVDYDRILVLDQGKVVEYDTPYALMTKENGVFKKMCDTSGDAAELLLLARRSLDSASSSITPVPSSSSSSAS
ncbi:P-loop containing nucleoside triphosphate hydrolase protein [Gongronella butleri]|nr:P-loop containing nucleoside triphosphate hydrolase protein [Gongronella butleri]